MGVPTATTFQMTDRDVATALLIHAKASAGLLAGAAMEASSADLCRLFESELTSRLQDQRAVFEYMRKKAWYDPAVGPLAMARADLDYAARAFD